MYHSVVKKTNSATFLKPKQATGRPLNASKSETIHVEYQNILLKCIGFGSKLEINENHSL